MKARYPVAAFLSGSPTDGWDYVPPEVKAHGVWRKMWACTMWGIWRGVCDITHDPHPAQQANAQQIVDQILRYITKTLGDCVQILSRGRQAAAHRIEVHQSVWSAIVETPKSSYMSVGAGEQTWRSAGGDDPT